MNNKELQEKYNSLTKELDQLKVEKIKLQTTLEALNVKKAELESKVKEIAAVNTVEEAKEKLNTVKATLDQLISKAEGLINDQQQ